MFLLNFLFNQKQDELNSKNVHNDKYSDVGNQMQTCDVRTILLFFLCKIIATGKKNRGE